MYLRVPLGSEQERLCEAETGSRVKVGAVLVCCVPACTAELQTGAPARSRSRVKGQEGGSLLVVA